MVSQLDCKQSILRRVTSLPGGLTPFQCTYCTGYTPALMPAPAAESCFHLTWLRKPPGQWALAAEEWSMCARAVDLSHSRRHPAFSNPFRRTPGQPSVPPIYPAASGPESAAVVLIVADVQAPNVCWSEETPSQVDAFNPEAKVRAAAGLSGAILQRRPHNTRGRMRGQVHPAAAPTAYGVLSAASLSTGSMRIQCGSTRWLTVATPTSSWISPAQNSCGLRASTMFVRRMPPVTTARSPGIR